MYEVTLANPCTLSLIVSIPLSAEALIKDDHSRGFDDMVKNIPASWKAKRIEAAAETLQACWTMISIAADSAGAMIS